MKLSSFGAGLTGVALVAGSMLLGSLPASAATEVTNLDFPLPAEGSSYPAGWFAGDTGEGTGSASQSAAGIAIVGGTNGYQMLNGVEGASVTLAAAANLEVSTTGGNAFYQISVFGEPNGEDKQFTTLRPVDASNLAGNWVTSRAFGSYAAFGEDTLEGFTVALDDGEQAQVLAFGLFVEPGATATVRAMSWNGTTYLFAAPPTAAVSPASVVASDTTTGITVTASGFAPGETVSGSISGPSENAFDDFVANSGGQVVYTFTGAPGGVGDYVFTYSDRSGLFSTSTTFSVVADAVVVPAAPAPTLPNTGIDAISAFAAAGVLLAAGAGFILFSKRRKAAAQA